MSFNKKKKNDISDNTPEEQINNLLDHKGKGSVIKAALLVVMFIVACTLIYFFLVDSGTMLNLKMFSDNSSKQVQILTTNDTILINDNLKVSVESVNMLCNKVNIVFKAVSSKDNITLNAKQIVLKKISIDDPRYSEVIMPENFNETYKISETPELIFQQDYCFSPSNQVYALMVYDESGTLIAQVVLPK